MPMTFEHTDTFGGEANYCWVNRASFEVVPPDRTIIRRAKAFAGFTGLRCQVSNYGDEIHIRPIGRNAPCQIVFVTFT